MTYRVVKCRHLHDKYIYLYECLPKKGWALVIYGPDDETIVEAQYFTDWGIALREYNRMKDELEKTE